MAISPMLTPAQVATSTQPVPYEDAKRAHAIIRQRVKHYPTNVGAGVRAVVELHTPIEGVEGLAVALVDGVRLDWPTATVRALAEHLDLP